VRSGGIGVSSRILNQINPLGYARRPSCIIAASPAQERLAELEQQWFSGSSDARLSIERTMLSIVAMENVILRAQERAEIAERSPLLKTYINHAAKSESRLNC
jgi:hypothetical protein